MNHKYWSLLLLIPVFFIPAVVAYLVGYQGFNLLDDGLWLLCTRTIAEGGLLYRDVFSIYGPAKFYALLPFFLVLGNSVHSLVVFKAVVAGTSSVLGFLVSRRYGAKHLAWLVPLGVIALGPIPPRYVCAVAFAVFHAEILSRGGRRFTGGMLLGLAWGGLALFGLDMLFYGAIVLVAGTAFFHTIGPSNSILSARRIVGVLVGFGGVAALSLLVAVATGILDIVVWDTVVYPLAYSPHHLGLNLLDGIFRPQGVGTVFSQVFTGESLGPAWPGHVWQRATAIRAMMALVIAAPVLGFTVRRRIVDPRLGSLFALALAGWIIVLWRNDVAHLVAAFYGTLLLLTCLLGVIRLAQVPTILIGVLFLTATMAPFAGERMWLMIHWDRTSLAQWDRPTAKIAIAQSRHDTIERLLESLGANDRDPTIAWPAQPGLVFLSGKSLATSQVTLLAGSVRDELSVIDALRESDPDQLVLGRIAGLAPGVRSMQSLVPSIWAYLRSHFFIEHKLVDGVEGFQVVRSVKKTGLDMKDLPLGRQLPGTSQIVRNSQTPALMPDTVIGQVFRVGGLDLRGFGLMVATTGALPIEVDIEVEVKELLADGQTHSLGRFGSRTPLTQRTQRIPLAFPAIPHTAGKRIVLSLSVASDSKHEIRLLWHHPQADEGDPIDYYPDGHVVLNGRPIDADLFFVSY